MRNHEADADSRKKVSLLERINAITWYHSFDFGNGLVSKSELDLLELTEANRRFLEKIDFCGKTVLDVGCYDGYWSFLAERRGASYVLAIDDISQRKRDESGFKLAHEIYQSKVEFRPHVSVYELSRLVGQQFDIVLYMGVYYHLTHMMVGFSEVRRVVKGNGYVVIEGAVIDDTCRSYAEFYYGEDGKEPYRTDKSNWFMPSRRCLKDMLRCSYFDIVDEFYMPHSARKSPRKGLKDRIRSLVGGSFEQSWAQPIQYGRMLLLCKPVVRADLNILHPLPFGLSDFDPRFCTKDR